MKVRVTRTPKQIIDRVVSHRITISEVARFLQVCVPTVRRYADDGHIAGSKTSGGQRVFTLESVFRFLSKHYSGCMPENNADFAKWISDTMLKIDDVADLLNLSQYQVRSAAESGKLFCLHYPGGHRRFRLSDVRSFAGTLTHRPSS